MELLILKAVYEKILMIFSNLYSLIKNFEETPGTLTNKQINLLKVWF